MWQEFTNPLVTPPVIKEVSSRPKKLKRKEVHESRVSSKFPKTEVTMTCSVFYVNGHNIRGCHFIRTDGVGSIDEEHRVTHISNVPEA